MPGKPQCKAISIKRNIYFDCKDTRTRCKETTPINSTRNQGEQEPEQNIVDK